MGDEPRRSAEMKDHAIRSFVGTAETIVDSYGHTAYRCAAYLTDGVYLPCVVLKSRRQWLDLALKRIAETGEEAEAARFLRRRQARANYEGVLDTFVAAGNRLNDYDIARLEPSPFALPARLLGEIAGETSMSWTQFVATMRDGRRFSFGTTFHIEFFAMPAGYSATDVVTIEAHKRESADLFRERPFFTCFTDAV